jgi:hypothetical protein
MDDRRKVMDNFPRVLLSLIEYRHGLELYLAGRCQNEYVILIETAIGRDNNEVDISKLRPDNLFYLAAFGENEANFHLR